MDRRQAEVAGNCLRKRRFPREWGTTYHDARTQCLKRQNMAGELALVGLPMHVGRRASTHGSNVTQRRQAINALVHDRRGPALARSDVADPGRLAGAETGTFGMAAVDSCVVFGYAILGQTRCLGLRNLCQPAGADCFSITDPGHRPGAWTYVQAPRC